jgi:hypothetical protein
MAVKTVLVPQKELPPQIGDKATFGLVRDLTVEEDLTNHYICRRGGTFLDCTVNAKVAPTGSTATLVIQKSTDQGATWVDVITLVLAAGNVGRQEYSEFTDETAIARGDFLRINCTQIGAGVPGKNIEVVLRWQ